MLSVMGDYAERGIYGIPIATLDCETTGLGREARICQIAIVHSDLGQGNSELVLNEYINPGIPIPSASSDIHGITDEQVSSCPNFWALYPRIQQRTTSHSTWIRSIRSWVVVRWTYQSIRGLVSADWFYHALWTTRTEVGEPTSWSQ